MTNTAHSFLSQIPPFDVLPDTVMQEVAQRVSWVAIAEGRPIYNVAKPLEGLYVVFSGQVNVYDAHGAQISALQRKDIFGERGLLQDGTAATSASAFEDCQLICLPPDLFHKLRAEQEAFARLFNGSGQAEAEQEEASDLTRTPLDSLMVPAPKTCTPEMSIQRAAQIMRDHHISCLCVVEGDGLIGIVTLRDLSGKALAGGLAHDAPISAIMTADPRALPPSAIGSDVLHLMAEHRLGHLPVVSDGRLVGIITQTDFTRFQAANSAGLVAEAARAETVQALAAVTGRIPTLLVNLVAAGNRHDVVTRLITDIADVITRRLLTLAENTLGPPPGRYAWLAGGWQGRQELSGVLNQDNCLVFEDGLSAEDDRYFEHLAQFVCDGLSACGYVRSPDLTVATDPRWRRSRSGWRDFLQRLIGNCNPDARAMVSMVFDLRPIGGDTALFDDLQTQLREVAGANSTQSAQMVGIIYSLMAPLAASKEAVTGGGTIDLGRSGVGPVIDLARLHALTGRLDVVNTRARLEAEATHRILGKKELCELIDAYDLVARTRLEYQAQRIKDGAALDSDFSFDALPNLERAQFRAALDVISDLWSGLSQGLDDFSP